MHPRVWAALVGVPVAVELAAFAAGRTEWTLSPHLRAWLRVDTPAGKAATIAGFGGGAAWLVQHLLTQPKES